MKKVVKAFIITLFLMAFTIGTAYAGGSGYKVNPSGTHVSSSWINPTTGLGEHENYHYNTKSGNVHHNQGWMNYNRNKAGSHETGLIKINRQGNTLKNGKGF